MRHLDWINDTVHMREWLFGDGTPTEPLRRELAAWLAHSCNSHAHAMSVLVDAFNVKDDE